MSILHIDNKNTLQISTQTLVGKSVAVLGITGSGKSNTAGVLIEELLSNGLPLTIIDIEGEYWGLKESFEVLVAGRSEHAELEVSVKGAGKLAEISVLRGISVILDLSDFSQEEAYAFLLEYFRSIWAVSTATRRPYQIVLEEAHEFIPQGINTPLKQILTRIALRGRKRGLGIILISQRSAKVEKDVLTQASLLFLHKVIHPIDLRVYKGLIPLPASEVEDLVRQLHPGEAIILFNDQTSVIQIRLRHTFHVGSTPTLSPIAEPTLRKLNDSVLRELCDLLVNSRQQGVEQDEHTKLTRRVMELEEELAQKDAEIERIHNQIELLSKLSISLEGWPSVSAIPSLQRLEIDRAFVGQIIEKDERERAAATNSVKSINLNIQQAGADLTSDEQKKLWYVIRRIQKLSKLQRSLLRLLVNHPGTAMTIPQIASWLSLKESTIRSRPPHDLIKMGMITRSRSKNGYQYRSSFHTYLLREFPQIDPHLLYQQIFR
jgi:uncharacterized protein